MMKRLICTSAMLLLTATMASAVSINVEVTNNQPMGGFTFSPVWWAFHDGSFDMFDSGSAASLGIENLAELANATELGNEFAASGASGVSGVLASPDAVPPFTPGESNSAMIDVGDATMHRYLSFGAMVVPSNDLFLGNDDPMGYEIFDAAGNFQGPVTIEIYGADVWDAGTEVNDVNNGIAFIVGQDATMGADEGGVVHTFFGSAGADAYIAAMQDLQTPAYQLTDLLTSGELLGTITITPEPTAMAMFGLVGLILTARRR